MVQSGGKNIELATMKYGEAMKVSYKQIHYNDKPTHTPTHHTSNREYLKPPFCAADAGAGRGGKDRSGTGEGKGGSGEEEEGRNHRLFLKEPRAFNGFRQ